MIKKKNEKGYLTERFREANLAVKEARQKEAAPWSSVAEATNDQAYLSPPPTLEKGRGVSSIPPEADDVPTQDFDEKVPKEESFADETGPTLVSSEISDEEVLATVPTTLRDVVREIFGTEFRASRGSPEIFRTNTTDKEENTTGDSEDFDAPEGS